MTVKEMIEVLGQTPQDAEVEIHLGEKMLCVKETYYNGDEENPRVIVFVKGKDQI